MKNFPIWKNRQISFQNLMNWNICCRGKFSGKSENYPLFHFFWKFWNITYPSLIVCKFSDRMELMEIFPIKSDELEHLQKVEILPKFDQLEYLQLRKIFRQIGKFSTFQLFQIFFSDRMEKVEMFPKKIMNWNICRWRISNKSENFPPYQNGGKSCGGKKSGGKKNCR